MWLYGKYVRARESLCDYMVNMLELANRYVTSL